jgi:hypothetical protein
MLLYHHIMVKGNPPHLPMQWPTSLPSGQYQDSWLVHVRSGVP